MPQKNTLRNYTEGGYYHIYNRGVEKRLIFNEERDYNFFISLIESYLTPKTPLGFVNIQDANQFYPYWRKLLEENEVELICYCLMPNHFHFLLKQNTKSGITRFMRRVSDAYVGYFNKKYERIGSLFQGKFKSAYVDSDAYLLHLSRYIHLNPIEVGPLNEFVYSSYYDFIGLRSTPWIKSKVVLDFFVKKSDYLSDYKNYTTYRDFVEKYKESAKIPEEVALD